MENIEYKGLVVSEQDGGYHQAIQTLSTEDLPAGDILIQVHYSSLNYKDALSATGNKGVTKSYPHTPGIDAAGIIVQSEDNEYHTGDQVVVIGYDLGMNTSGGFGQYIRVPAHWAVKLPTGLTLKESMIIGTAGFTAGISVSRLSELVKPEDGKILVSGATGGVGSISLALLVKLGYETVSITGKEIEYDFLRNLGSSEIISREEFLTPDKRPLLSAHYAGAIDTVGGAVLENILKVLKPSGAVTTCGSVASIQLNTTVFPFILRGNTLIGISAQNYPSTERLALWNKLANEWKPGNLLKLYTEIELDNVKEYIELILAGKLTGRIIINMRNN